MFTYVHRLLCDIASFHVFVFKLNYLKGIAWLVLLVFAIFNLTADVQFFVFKDDFLFINKKTCSDEFKN